MNGAEEQAFEVDAEPKIEEVLKTGKYYAEAIRTLLPDLVITPDDEAAGFDVGSGADLVAFHTLGFKHAIWTNDPEAAFMFAWQKSHDLEQKLLSAVLKTIPHRYYGSSLGLGDWLDVESFKPKLITMLHIAPMYFRSEANPAHFLKLFGECAKKLPVSSGIILSDRGDHPNGERAFMLAHDHFLAEGFSSQLLQNVEANDLRKLGRTVLVLRGALN